MFADLPRPTIFAHRGSSAHAPENTLAAFRMAVGQDADAIELDAKLTADKKIVVIHDQTVDRTTDGAGSVRKMTLAEIRRLDAGSSFDVAYQGEPIPTLEDVLEEVGRRIYTNIELTNYATPWDDLPERAATLVKKMHLAPRVMFSSFNPVALIRVRRLLPDSPCGLLCLPGRAGLLCRTVFRTVIPHQAFHPEIGDVTPELIHKVHQKGNRINVYTVNDPARMRVLFAWEVDGIFTDDPQLARQVLDAAQSEKRK